MKWKYVLPSIIVTLLFIVGLGEFRIYSQNLVLKGVHSTISFSIDYPEKFKAIQNSYWEQFKGIPRR